MNALRLAILAALGPALSLAAEPRSVSGIYPHLAMFNEEGECGTGAVVPWADRLWVVTYGPHKPEGSSDKLYEITPALEQIVRPESIGGTPANRMIHRESNQLFIGPYAIDGQGKVRAIPYKAMFGRPTGLARHLTDPAGKIVFATMEEGIYEVDVKTLTPTVLWTDEQIKGGRHADLPGYHGKGFYSGQGRYIYANNGDHAAEARTNPNVPSGVLAEWDGEAAQWTVVRRNQFTDVTGPGGIEGSPPDAPLWSIGWDHRSLLLMLLDGGKWSSFRLPKATHTYDGAHGWNTEWPRIRDIGEDALLMTMHGEFWRFPRTFSAANTAGIAPRSTYLKVIGDFARWKDQLVLGCDDTAKLEFINADSIKGKIAAPGVSQSNLWFVKPEQLDQGGPTLGRGAVWLDDPVKASVPSDAFLFTGFARRSLHLAQDGAEALTVTIEVDVKGDGVWRKLRDISVPAKGAAWTEFPENEAGVWLRLKASQDVASATAFFHYRGVDSRGPQAASIFQGIAGPADTATSTGLLRTRNSNFKTLRFLAQNGSIYDLDGDLRLTKADPAADVDNATWMAKTVAMPKSSFVTDNSSVLYIDGKGQRWRLPKGDPALEQDGPSGPSRLCREVSTERNLLNVGGTFYELPADNAGGFIKLRPVATHNRRIHDFASYRGMLVMSGITAQASAEPSGHLIRSEDGQAALWCGAVDDLWRFGKPRGMGGPWQQSAVKAKVPSDPYLATGYDHKRLHLTSSVATHFHLEADFTGTGKWSEVTKLSAPAGQSVEYQFPEGFGAYWLRLVADADTTATAVFQYE